MATKTLQSPMSNHLAGHGTLSSVKAVETELPRVPVVTHVLTDEDVGLFQGAKVQPVNLNKVVKLLTDPHSAMLYDRHTHALNKVIRHYPDGFLMKDLVAIFKILNVCADRVEDHPVYVEPMLHLLKLCRFPFLKEKSSDETSYEQIAAESVSQLGYLMRVPSGPIRHEICRTLEDFYCLPPSKKQLQGLKPNSLTYNQKIVEESDVAETLVKSLALIEKDLDVKLMVLCVLQKLSKNSAHNCNLMLRANGASRICGRLMDYDPSGQLLFRSCDILWNLLEQGDQTEVAHQLNNLTCIGQLRDAFIHQLTQGYSHYDRQLRNDLLVIASLVAKTCSDAPFIETGFVKQLVLLATFQEVKSHHAMVKHLKLGQNHEDFEIKKLLVNILISLSADSSVIPLLSDCRLLLALFSYVKSNEKTSGPREWTVAQLEELQLHSMTALATLGPILIDDYMTCQGGTRLLLLLEWCTGSDDFKGQGNSFFGRGGRGNKRAQMRHCIRLMRSMVSTGENVVLQDFVDQGAVHQLTGILSIMCKTSHAKQDAVDIEMQCDMLFILSALCDGDMHRKELFGSQGVDVVITYLKIDPEILTGGLGHNRLMLTAVDCIWCAVVGCYVTEDEFLEREGVFLLIDILEKCPKNMHNLVLGCLLDLSENAKTIPHINAWRGNGDISAAHLFSEIWRKEENDMNVNRESTGAISDVKKPLIGELQEKQGVTTLPANAPSQAIVDVSENMRAKIYALFCKLGFIELPGLTTEDHITLTIIEHYLDFKLGEVWSEVITELEQDNIRPTTPDKEALEAISRTVDERAEHVLDVQRELLDAQLQQDLIDEQEFYAEIRENHRQKEKAINDFHDYIARTSNYTLLRAAKQRQETSIDASRVQTNYKSSETFHATEIPNLQTTTFSGRNVTIESTPMDLTGGLLSNYDPITGTLKKRTMFGDPDKDSDESQATGDGVGSREEIVSPEKHMEEALKALDVLDKNDITELKSLMNPPALVKQVMDAVCILLHQKPDWISARGLLADPFFLGKLIEFVPDSITDGQLKKLSPYVNNTEFVPERVAKVSVAAVGICKWVRALYIYARASRDLQRTQAEERKRHQKQLLIDMKEERRDSTKELVK